MATTMHRLNIYLDEADYAALMTLAAKERQSMSAAVRSLIRTSRPTLTLNLSADSTAATAQLAEVIDRLNRIAPWTDAR